MTDAVLLLGSHLGKGVLKAIRTEDRVVAEALCPTPLCCYLASNDTFKEVFLLDAGAATGTHILLLDEGDDGAETCLAVVLVVEFAQQASHIGLAVVTGSIGLHAGIAGAVDAWGTIQRFHLETRIIGKAVQMIVVIDIACLLQGILFEGLARLRDIHIAADVLEREHLYPIAQNLAYFLQLVLVVGGEYYFHS